MSVIIVIRDITKQKKLEEQLKHLAYFDGLTNIYNRSYFLEKSSEQLENAIQNKTPLSFILFDIDYFKKINDHFGHHTGDAAIRHVVSICKKVLEHDSIFGRYGGEEFVICLPDKTLSEAGRIAEKFGQPLKKHRLKPIKDLFSSQPVLAFLTLNDILEHSKSSFMNPISLYMHPKKAAETRFIFLSIVLMYVINHW